MSSRTAGGDREMALERRWTTATLSRRTGSQACACSMMDGHLEPPTWFALGILLDVHVKVVPVLLELLAQEVAAQLNEQNSGASPQPRALNGLLLRATHLSEMPNLVDIRLTPRMDHACVAHCPEPFGVRPLGGTRHMTFVCEGRCSCAGWVLW
jgi:hypothetical protein